MSAIGPGQVRRTGLYSKLFWPRRAWMACMIPFAGVSAVVPTLEGLRVLNARRLRARGVDAVVPVAIDPKVRFSEGRDMPPTRAHLDRTRTVITVTVAHACSPTGHPASSPRLPDLRLGRSQRVSVALWARSMDCYELQRLRLRLSCDGAGDG